VKGESGMEMKVEMEKEAGEGAYPLRQLKIDCAVPAVSGFERLLNYKRLCVSALKTNPC